MKYKRNIVQIISFVGALATIISLIAALFTILFDSDRFITNSIFLTMILILVAACIIVIYSFLLIQRINPTKYIFISSSYADKQIAESVQQILSEQFRRMSKYRFEILTFDTIPYGSNIQETARKYLEKADIIVVIVSENYMSSKSCNREFRTFWDLNKKVIPVVLGPFEDLSRLPVNISKIKALSLAECKSDEDFEHQLVHLTKDLIRQRQD